MQRFYLCVHTIRHVFWLHYCLHCLFIFIKCFYCTFRSAAGEGGAYASRTRGQWTVQQLHTCSVQYGVHGILRGYSRTLVPYWVRHCFVSPSEFHIVTAVCSYKHSILNSVPSFFHVRVVAGVVD